MDTSEKYLEKSSKISVEDMQELVSKVKDFYEERDNPKMDVIWLSNLILRRLKNDFDHYTNIEGIKGYGKSNLMLLLGLLQCRYSGLWKNKTTGKIVKVLPRRIPLSKEWEQIETGFDFDKNMSFLDNTKELQTKYNLLDRYMPFCLDEGSKNLHKYVWQSRLQFMLIKMSDTERYQNKSFFICFPNFKELNSIFRNDRVQMRLYVYHRSSSKGFAGCIISLRDVSRWILDPWHMDENAKQFEHLLRRVPMATRNYQHILYAEKKLKGYAGNFDFPSLKNIAPKIWKIYMRYKTLNAKREKTEEETETEKESKNTIRWKYATKMLMAYIKKNNKELKTIDFKDLTGISTVSLNKLWREKLEIEQHEELKQKATRLLATKVEGRKI